MVCLSSTLAAFSPKVRLLPKTLLATSLLAGVSWSSSAQADSLFPTPIDFFFDLVGDRFADMQPAGEEAARRALIAGVPLTIDARDGEAAADRRMTAGAKGRYSLNIADTIAVVGNAKIAGTEFVDEQLPSRAIASAGADFRYVHQGWKLGFTPGLEVLHEETGFAQQDSVIEGRLSKAIGGGVSMAATARYRWRESVSEDAPDREIASGRIGFASRLPHEARMDLAYVGRQEVVVTGPEYGQPELIRGFGPSVAFALPLLRTVDFSANYDFTGQTCFGGALDGQPGWRTEDDLHRLNLALTWDLGGDPDAIQLSASYRYERGGADEYVPDDRHAGAVSLAVFF